MGTRALWSSFWCGVLARLGYGLAPADNLATEGAVKRIKTTFEKFEIK